MKIEARTLKGFRDFLPEDVHTRRQVKKVFEDFFEKYGYQPLETPTLEYFDILMGKYGEEEKLVYSFKDHGDRHVALKYDLTVPTSRVVAQHQNKLVMPWKRYQIQPVWRADNTQKGRFREFLQCDADVFGSKDMIAEAEFIKMGIEILQKLGFTDFVVMLSNRKILNAIAEYAGREDLFLDIVYAIDKWDKRTVDETKSDLIKRGLDDDQAQKVINCMSIDTSNNLKALNELQNLIGETKEGLQGINELKQIINLVNSDKTRFLPTIARGLAYYTGPVWEWNIIDGGVGSVGGGGRYDKLIGSFIGQDIPATGGSFGFERILEVMKDRGMIQTNLGTSKVLVTIFDENSAADSFGIAEELRNADIKTEIYPTFSTLKKQIEYANKKGIKFVIIIGEEEKAEGLITLKNMEIGEQHRLSINEVINLLK